MPLRLLVHRGGVKLESVSWRNYWHSCKPFYSVDARLVQRLNRLKSAWLEVVPYLPVRRFNPASLTTTSGRSIVAQLTKVASAIIIEDLDLSPENLIHHQQQFGLADTACVQCRRDGFVTQVYHYVVATPDVVENLQGDHLW